MDIGKLTEWNPWWEDKGQIDKLKGIPRPEYKALVKSIDVDEVSIVTGVRRAGKSTLMYQMVDDLLKRGVDPKDILFVNLEDKKLMGDSLDDIYAAYRENMNPDKKAYVFLDEVHKRDGWESWVRRKYDTKADVKFVISGSCSYLLKREYSTLLTGRNLTFDVFPLGLREYLSFKGINVDEKNLERGVLLERTKSQILNNLNEYLKIGGFPKVLLESEAYKQKLLEQYFDDILYKDIVDRYNVNSQKVRDLGLFLATNFTSTASLRNIRNSLGISYDTIKDYLSYFHEAFMFFSLDHFSYSLKEQKTLASKVYCIDNGLRNAVSFRFSRDEGRLAENMVFVELKRRGKDVYYWRGKGEVDFVVKDEGLTAVNVSYTDEIDPREVKGLQEFNKRFKARLVLLTKDVEKKQDGVSFIPLWKWLLEAPAAGPKKGVV
jgi:predicted AAA+ superfamily ATPase